MFACTLWVAATLLELTNWCQFLCLCPLTDDKLRLEQSSNQIETAINSSTSSRTYSGQLTNRCAMWGGNLTSVIDNGVENLPLYGRDRGTSCPTLCWIVVDRSPWAPVPLAWGLMYNQFFWRHCFDPEHIHVFAWAPGGITQNAWPEIEMLPKITETRNKACVIFWSYISKVSAVTYPDFFYPRTIRYFPFKKSRDSGTSCPTLCWSVVEETIRQHVYVLDQKQCLQKNGAIQYLTLIISLLLIIII